MTTMKGRMLTTMRMGHHVVSTTSCRLRTFFPAKQIRSFDTESLRSAKYKMKDLFNPRKCYWRQYSVHEYKEPNGKPHFSELPLNRAGHLRKARKEMQDLLQDPSSLAIVFVERNAVVQPCTPSNQRKVWNLSCEIDSKDLDSLLESSKLHDPDIGRTETGGDLENTGWPLPCSFALSDDYKTPDGAIPKWNLLAWPICHQDLTEVNLDSDTGFIFLGLTKLGRAIFACQLSSIPRKIEKQQVMDYEGFSKNESDLFRMINVRSGGQEMTGGDAAVLALASGLFSWHENSAYCGKTGLSTTTEAAGHARRVIMANTDAGSAGKWTEIETQIRSIKSETSGSRQGVVHSSKAVYPRIDPAVIICIEFEDWLLLGRKKSWTNGRYSLLAGFVEVGEALESAVEREVFEEAGVHLDPSSIKYHSSQPWPFPQSLMIGFNAKCILENETFQFEGNPFEYMSFDARRAALEVGLFQDEARRYGSYRLPQVAVDKDELEDARWFHKGWLADKVLHTRNNPIQSKIESDGYYCSPLISCRGTLDDTSWQYPSKGFRIPGKYALANRIITDCLIQYVNENHIEDLEGISWSGEKVIDIAIDSGTFKYVLLRIYDERTNRSKLIVRGDSRAPYHNDIYQFAKRSLHKIDDSLKIDTVGGGRMEHDVQTRTLKIYGHSMAFGQAPHDITADILRRAMPLYEISVSYAGY